jgi:hypothetical protein
MKYKNTFQKGSVRVMIFKEGSTWFGVALEFNIVETGDDPREVMVLLDEAIRGYLHSGRKASLRPVVLNQKPDPEYEKMWNALEARRTLPPQFKVHSFGERSLAVA